MLITDDYIKYYYSNTEMYALQIAKYHLIRWGKIEKNIVDLGSDLKPIAKSLFGALRKLTIDERAILAAKYRTDEKGRPSKTDKEAADALDMELLKYQELRRGIEHKFYYYIKDSLN